MNPHRRRRLVLFGLLSTLVFSTTVVLLRIKQHSFRVHAQHTLDNMQHLQIGTSNACEVYSEWQNKWGSGVSSEGACNDPNHFSMDLSVQHPLYIWTNCFKRRPGGILRLLVRGMCGTYEALSGRIIVLRAHVEGVRGAVTRKSFTVYIPVPDDDPSEDLPATVFAMAEVPAQLVLPRGRVRGSDAQSDVLQLSLHPSYRVFVNKARVNADYDPQGRVFYIEAEIGPDAGRSDSERLFGINLSCLTRMRPCSRQDLMPAAYKQYELDVRQSQAASQQ